MWWRCGGAVAAKPAAACVGGWSSCSDGRDCRVSGITASVPQQPTRRDANGRSRGRDAAGLLLGLTTRPSMGTHILCVAAWCTIARVDGDILLIHDGTSRCRAALFLPAKHGAAWRASTSSQHGISSSRPWPSSRSTAVDLPFRASTLRTSTDLFTAGRGAPTRILPADTRRAASSIRADGLLPARRDLARCVPSDTMLCYNGRPAVHGSFHNGGIRCAWRRSKRGGIRRACSCISVGRLARPERRLMRGWGARSGGLPYRKR